MTPVGLLGITVTILLILLTLAWQSYRAGFLIRFVVCALTLLHESVLVAFPIWHSVFTEFELETDISVTPDELLMVTIGELLFVVMFWLGMNIRFRKGCLRSAGAGGELQKTCERSLLSLLVLAGLTIYAAQFFSEIESFEASTQHAEIKVADSFLGMVGEWARGAFQFPSLIAATLSALSAELGVVARLGGIATLLLLGLAGLSAGHRGRLTWIISLLVSVGGMQKRWRAVGIGLLLLTVALPLAPFLGGEFREIYFSRLTGASRMEAVGFIFNAMKEGSYSLDMDQFIRMLANRAQGPRNSVILYRLHDDGDPAGFRPLEGALYLPIPRVLWPEKRPAGSTDDTNYGSAIFIVRRIGYDAPFHNMGPILASGHAYWEAGWLWLALAGFLTGFLWNVVLHWCENLGRTVGSIIALTLASALLIDGLLTALYPLHALISKFWSSILPLMVVLALLRVLLPLARKMRPASSPKPVETSASSSC